MAVDISEILKKALALPVEARAALASSLLDSLDTSVDEAVEAAWEKEITRRIADLDNGTVKAIPWSEVRRNVTKAAGWRGLLNSTLRRYTRP